MALALVDVLPDNDVCEICLLKFCIFYLYSGLKIYLLGVISFANNFFSKPATTLKFLSSFVFL